MPHRRRFWIPLLLVLLAGCSGLLLNAQQAAKHHNGSSGQRPDAIRTFRTGSLTSATGCEIQYRLYLPVAKHDLGNPHRRLSSRPQAVVSAQPHSGDLVILAHGFLRNQQRMQGLAARIAEAGYPVATLDFCNQRFWDGAHGQNARDMIALARHLDADRRVYVGFSAGGLSALLAAREDALTLGVVTLDLVDAGNQGQRAARDLERPLLGLAGAPTNCNALNNADPVFEAAGRSALKRLPEASHCDFESPTDTVCALVCTDPDKGEGSQSMPASPIGFVDDSTASNLSSAEFREQQSEPDNPNTAVILAETLDAVRRLFDPDPLAWRGWHP